MQNFDYKLKYKDLPDRIMIFGPPGTGKTHTLEHIYNSYRENVVGYPDAVYITYSKSMAESARERLNMFKEKVGTFHSIFTHVIQWNTFLNDDDYTEFAKKYGVKKTVNMDITDPDEIIIIDDLSYFLSMYNRLYFNYYYNPEKHINEIQHQIYMEEGREMDFSFLFDRYESFKHTKRKHDYTDIIVHMYQNPENLPRLDMLEVDEAQDMRPIMWKILELWEDKVDKIVIAGDDDQNIYYYDGANVKDMLNYSRKCTVYHLSQSYRLPKSIHKEANSLIQNVHVREKKEFFPNDEDGEVRNYITLQEAIKYLSSLEGSKFILARTTYLVRKVTEILDLMRMPYLSINPRHYMLSPYSHSDFDLVNTLINFPPKTLDDMRKIIINLPADVLIRGVKTAFVKRNYKDIPVTLSQFTGNYFESLFKTPMTREEIISMLDVDYRKKMKIKNLVENGILINADEVIKLDTIHASKGREADHVLLINNISRRIYNMQIESQEIMDAETRIKYVGMTRARKTLIIVNDYALSGFSFAI